MANKEMLSHAIPVIQEAITGESGNKLSTKWTSALNKIRIYLKGGNEKKTFAADPAAELISQIENEEVASIVRDLHYKTPQSLKAMRKSCQECFMLPDDCPYYDYSIFDVRKATRMLMGQPKHTHKQVIKKLQQINNELAYHLNENFD